MRIGGITHKMLTQTLRVLEENGLVDRCVTPSIPVTVDYSLTPLGKGLLPVVHAIKQWAEANVNEVKAARQHYARPLGGGAETAQLVAARRNSGTVS